jgi:oxalate decarboxylase
MPNFKYSLDGSIPKSVSGGWAKESTEHQLPASKRIAFDAFPKGEMAGDHFR